MNNINKKAELCSQLNMDFEEANELFEEESLGSLQMARVNGGFILTVDAVCKIITCVVGVASLVYKIISETTKDPNDNTSREDSERLIRDMASEIVKSGKGGVIRADSIVNSGIYKLEFQIGVATPPPAQ